MLQLPCVQIEPDAFQTVETFKTIPTVKHRISSVLRPGSVHKSLKGDMAYIRLTVFNPGERLGSTDTLRELFLGETGFYPGFFDKQIGVMYWHENFLHRGYFIENMTGNCQYIGYYYIIVKDKMQGYKTSVRL